MVAGVGPETRRFLRRGWCGGVERIRLRCGVVRDAGAGVEAANFCKFIGYPRVDAYCVVVGSLRHERPQGDQAGHFRVVVGVGEIEFADSVLSCEDVTEG